MKCEIVRDLLPLYVDKLTSKTSTREIERHLKGCKECQKYYQEMTGALPDFQPKVEIDSVKLLKRERNKRRLISAGIVILCLITCILVLEMTPREINYKDVQLDYWMEKNTVHVSLRPKYYVGNIMFNGVSDQYRDENGKKIMSYRFEVRYSKGIWGMKGRGCDWYTDLNQDETAEWEFTFHDKVVTIRNGELVSLCDVK